jgi:hypothetical protein
MNLQVCRINLYTDLNNKVFNSSLISLHPEYIFYRDGNNVIKTVHTKGPGKCVGLYMMSEYSGFILVNRNTLGPSIFIKNKCGQ